MRPMCLKFKYLDKLICGRAPGARQANKTPHMEHSTECAELAPAFRAPPLHNSASKLDALPPITRSKNRIANARPSIPWQRPIITSYNWAICSCNCCTTTACTGPWLNSAARAITRLCQILPRSTPPTCHLLPQAVHGLVRHGAGSRTQGLTAERQIDSMRRSTDNHL